MDNNLYAPPETPIITSNASMWRYDGKHLWIKDGAILPERCIVTNKSKTENSNLRIMEKRLTWSSPYFAFLILINIFLYLIVALCVQKKGKITIHIDQSFLKKRNRRCCAALFGIILSCALLIGGAVYNDQYVHNELIGAILMITGFLTLLTSVYLIIRFSSLIRATKHTEGWFRLSGVKQPFLDSL